MRQVFLSTALHGFVLGARLWGAVCAVLALGLYLVEPRPALLVAVVLEVVIALSAHALLKRGYA